MQRTIKNKEESIHLFLNVIIVKFLQDMQNFANNFVLNTYKICTRVFNSLNLAIAKLLYYKKSYHYDVNDFDP